MSQYDEIRQELLQQRQEILQRVSAIEKDLRNETNPLEKDYEEQAIRLENDEVLEELDREGQETLLKINQALQRIEAGTYDICSRCGAKIPLERLKAVPYTTLCVDCAAEVGE